MRAKSLDRQVVDEDTHDNGVERETGKQLLRNGRKKGSRRRAHCRKRRHASRQQRSFLTRNERAEQREHRNEERAALSLSLCVSASLFVSLRYYVAPFLFSRPTFAVAAVRDGAHATHVYCTLHTAKRNQKATAAARARFAHVGANPC